MNEDCLKLTAYFGERDRVRDGFLADALVDIFARHALQTSLVLRGIEGFGAKHRPRSDRLLTLSEDLPLAAVAVDARERIERAHGDVTALRLGGLVTLERARMLTGAIGPVALSEPAKLTVYVGRRERVGATSAYEAVVALLHRHGIAGASVLLGVDGTAHGERRRARFFGRNAGVPLMIVAVGDGGRVGGVVAELGAMLQRPLMTLERVRICKRDGARLGDPAGDNKLMVYAEEALHGELVRRLRRAGAAGATTLRGIWGYHGDHAPHGDALWQLRRRVPVVTVIVDTPERVRDWFAIVDDVTRVTGLVTSELVPTATSPRTPVVKP